MNVAADPHMRPIELFEPPATHTRVLVVDDHAAVRAGLRELLDDEADFEVVAAVDSAEEGMSVAERRPIDVAVVDYQLGGRNGLWLSRKLKRLPDAAGGAHLLGLRRRRARRGGRGGRGRRDREQGQGSDPSCAMRSVA